MMRLFFPLALTAMAAFGQQSITPADLAEGGRLYRANCTICHGAEGNEVPGIDLGHNKFRRAKDDDDIAAIIRSGIAGTAMPPNNFSNFQSLTIVAYLRSIAPSASATTAGGDPARGKAVYEGKAGCANCHRIRGVGSRKGPDLSEIGNLRLATELEQKLVNPDTHVAEQNRHFRGVAKDGTTITGRLLNEDKYSLQILDSNDRLVSIQRANLREATIVNNALMPSYKDMLSASERADLVSYLVSLKGVELKGVELKGVELKGVELK